MSSGMSCDVRKSLRCFRETDARTKSGRIKAMKLKGPLRMLNKEAVTKALAGSRWPPKIMKTRYPATRTWLVKRNNSRI